MEEKLFLGLDPDCATNSGTLKKWKFLISSKAAKPSKAPPEIKNEIPAQIGEFRTFTSLNCSFCSQPFEASVASPRSPLQLGCANCAICKECFDREISLNVEERRKCCLVLYESFTNTKPALFLIAVLANDSLVLSPDGSGYLLQKPFIVPECPICNEEYSLSNEEREPLVLFCRHAICSECYWLNRKENPHPDRPLKNQIQCPVCSQESLISPYLKMRNNRLKDFLKELPEMNNQLEKFQKLHSRKCNNCPKTEYVDEMFRCTECQQVICALCAMRRHSGHKTEEFLFEEAKRVSGKIGRDLEAAFSSFHLESQNFREEIDAKLLDIKSKLLERAKSIEKKTFIGVQFESQKCREALNNFRQVTDQYLDISKDLDANFQKLQATMSSGSD